MGNNPGEFEVRLREILYANQPSVCEDSGQAEWTVGEAQKVVDEILKLVKGIVPEEKKIRYVSGSKKIDKYGNIVEMKENITYDKEAQAFNSCRLSILKALGYSDAS